MTIQYPVWVEKDPTGAIIALHAYPSLSIAKDHVLEPMKADEAHALARHEWFGTPLPEDLT